MSLIFKLIFFQDLLLLIQFHLKKYKQQYLNSVGPLSIGSKSGEGSLWREEGSEG